MEDPLISVIIPAYNERERIVDALKSIKNQSYDRIESIVVANGCRDDTVKVAKEFATRVINIPTQGLSRAKNWGYANSNGSICSFMDADSIAESDLFEEVYNSINKGFDGGKAKIRSSDDGRLRAKIFCLYSELLSRTIEKYTPQSTGAGAFTFLTKELGNKIKINGEQIYDEKLNVMEDVDLLNRMKKQGNYKFITESHLNTSMRRFMEEGYIKCFFEDTFHVLNPEGKTRARWND